ncbi:MAG: hypothetical protein IKN04_09345, partial [Clostridia bacterium]|nr:hypothetical protein [Clostridia bacterium]
MGMTSLKSICQKSKELLMLAPGRGRGEELKLAIESYRERILKMIPDTAKQRIIASD